MLIFCFCELCNIFKDLRDSRHNRIRIYIHFIGRHFFKFSLAEILNSQCPTLLQKLNTYFFFDSYRECIGSVNFHLLQVVAASIFKQVYESGWCGAVVSSKIRAAIRAQQSPSPRNSMRNRLQLRLHCEHWQISRPPWDKWFPHWHQ